MECRALQTEVSRDQGAGGVWDFEMGEGGQCAGPGDVAMACGVEGVPGLAEGPVRSGMCFAQGEIIRGHIGLRLGKVFFARGELVHDRESEVMFLAAEVHFPKATGVLRGGQQIWRPSPDSSPAACTCGRCSRK